MRAIAALGVSATLILASCHKDSTGPAGPLDGSWTGTVTGEFTMDATFSDHGGAVSGSGDFNGVAIVDPPIAFAVVGTDNGGSFSVTLTAQGRSGSVGFSGTVTNATTITGTLSGGIASPIVLTRD